MKILVTGAAGMLGSALCQKISDSEHQLIAVYHSGQNQTCDITNRFDVKKLISDHKPDIIINSAAHCQVDRCEEDQEWAEAVNNGGVKNLAELAKEYKSQLIHISTDFVYSGKARQPYVETDQCEPVNKYGLYKLRGELAAQEANPNVIILRTAWLYGATRSNFVLRLLDDIKAQKKSIAIVNDKWGSPTSVILLSDLIVKIVDSIVQKKRISGIYHAVATGGCSWLEFAEYIIRICGVRDITIKPISMESLGLPATRPTHTILSNQKLQSVLQSEIPTWRQDIETFIGKNYIKSGKKMHA